MTALVERLGDRLAALRLRLAVAESCTGGLVTGRITDLPGASRFLVAGLVTYSDDAKVRVLGVPAETISAHGAVSEPVARAMAEGARAAGNADVAVAVTGIAGPDGGTAEKPVGTVWLAASVLDRSAAEQHHFRGDRTEIRASAVLAALEMLDRMLEHT